MGVIGVGVAVYRGAKIDALDAIMRSVTSSQRTFHDTEFGISFRYPRGWEQQYVSPNIILFSTEGAGPTMTLVLTKRKEAETLQQFREKNVQEIQESASSAGRKIEVEPVQEKMLGKLSAEQFMYHIQESGVSIDGIQVFAVNDKKEYILTFAARHDTFPAAVQEFDSVLKSVRIN